MWNETFEFTDFTVDMDVLVKVFDKPNTGKVKYIGHIAMLVEPLQLMRERHDWFPIDPEVFCRTRLFTGCNDKTARMFDIRVNKELRCFAAHLGPVMGIKTCLVQGQVQLFTCAEDGMVKLWDLSKAEARVERASRSWPHDAAVAGCEPVVIFNQLRVFAACKDAVAYMWTLPSQGMIISEGWRQRLAKWIDSIQVCLSVSVSLFVCVYLCVCLSVDRLHPGLVLHPLVVVMMMKRRKRWWWCGGGGLGLLLLLLRRRRKRRREGRGW